MATSDAPERRSWAVPLVVAVLACAVLTWWLRSAAGDDGRDDPAAVVQPPDLHLLAAATTQAHLRHAPLDDARRSVPTGLVVHPRHTVALWDAPSGTAFAKLTPDQFGDTWVPVVARRDGWVRVLLPSRPNGSTGWLQTSGLVRARSPYLVQVHLGSRSLELSDDGVPAGTWPVAVGAAATPTPTGRTFLLGQLTDPDQSYSPVIIPLGTHSQTLDTYGGGPGTVAIHGWTDPSVFGQAVSHGCVRVPADALAVIRTLPLGTPVLIDNG